MFSTRFHWATTPNRLTRLLEHKRAAGAAILDLTQSNPTRASLDYPPEIPSALASSAALDYDPVPKGSASARDAVSDYYTSRGHCVDPGRILLTASTSEGYSYLFKLLTDPGHEILVPIPSYPLFEYLAVMESLTVHPYPLVYEHGWSVDLDALAAAVTERTRAIVVVNPNNPTGSYLKRHELESMVRLCRDRNLALISDEVFADYELTQDERRIRSVCDVADCLAFSMSGLSKVAGLPQMKLGWIVAAGPSDLRRTALEKLEWIADTYLSVSTPVQCAASELLRHGQTVQDLIRARTRANLDWLRQALSASPLAVLDVEGGWYAVIRLPRIRTEEEWTLDLLDRHNVLIQPGFFYDFESEAFLVASLLTEKTTFREGVMRLLSLAGVQ